MDTRTILLALHITSVAAWLGADLLQYAFGHRWAKESTEGAAAWARQVHWMHERYYAIVALCVLATGVLLVLDGDWSWSAGFIWVGVGAIVGGAVLGGGGLGALAKRRVAALESGDTAEADALHRRMLPLMLVVTALPLVALVAMIERWQA